jgi:hypothetical protein
MSMSGGPARADLYVGLCVRKFNTSQRGAEPQVKRKRAKRLRGGWYGYQPEISVSKTWLLDVALATTRCFCNSSVMERSPAGCFQALEWAV